MKLVKNNSYLLLIDEEAKIKEGNIAIHNFGMGYDLEIPCDKDNLKSNTRKLVVAYYPLTKEAKELDLPLLPNPFKKYTIMYNLLNKDIPSAMSNYGKGDGTMETSIDYNKGHRDSWIKGYKAAQSKQFSLEDVIKAIDMSRLQGSEPFLCKYSDDEIIQSLSTQPLPKEFIPEYYTNGDMIVRNRNEVRGLVGTYKY